MNEKEARENLNKLPNTLDCTWQQVKQKGISEGYLEALEKAKVMVELLQKLVKMKANFGYKSPEQQDIQVTTLIVNIGAWAEEALAKWEKEI